MSTRGVISKTYEDECAYCGKWEELCPYGANGESICFECAMKPENKAMTQRKFQEVEFGMRYH